MIVLALLCVGTFAVPESASALAKKPERVTVIKAESAYDSITLTWKPSENARSYIIYRSGSKYGFYREIGTVATNTYTDKRLQTGKAMWYKIRAVNDGRRSFKSPRISAVPSLAPPTLTAEATGEGGIETWRDAAEFLAVGCRNIQVTTAIMQYGYRIVEDMISGMQYFMDERGYNSLDEFVGCALPKLIPAEELNREYKVLPKFDDKKCIGCGRCYISCYDAAHQAIDWNEKKRRPELNDNCVGCHLCLNVCPVAECITPGEIKWKVRDKNGVALRVKDDPAKVQFKSDPKKDATLALKAHYE